MEPLTSRKITRRCLRGFFPWKARSIGSPPRGMLRRMVRRTSTRSARFWMWRRRESRRLILRNRRAEICSSAARASPGTSDRSTVCRRCCALAPDTSLPSRSAEEASFADCASNARELACGRCVRNRASLLPSDGDSCVPCAALQKISKSSLNRSHSSFDEVSTARKANANSSRPPALIVFATCTASKVCCTPMDKPLLRANRQNSMMAAAERSGSSCCIIIIHRPPAWTFRLAGKSCNHGAKLRKHFFDARRLELRAVFLRFHHAAQGFLDRLHVQPLFSQSHRGLRAIQSFRHAGRLDQIQLAHGVNEADHLLAQLLRDPRQPSAHYFHLFFKAGIVNPVIKAAPLQRVAQFPRAVRGQDHVRHIFGLDGAHLRHGDLKIGEKLQQKRLEGLIGAVNFVNQQHR